MFPVQTKITRKGSGDVTDPFCPPSALLPSGSRPAHPEQLPGCAPFAREAPDGAPPLSDAGAMYTFAHAQPVASAEQWVPIAVRRELAEAITLMEDAGAELVALAADAAWESDGFRALQELLSRLRDDTGAEVGELAVREWELGG